MKDERFLHTGKSTHWWGGQSVWGRVFLSLRREHSNRFMDSKAERDFIEDLVLTGTPQPEMLVRWGRASWVVRLGLQRVGEGRGLGLAVRR